MFSIILLLFIIVPCNDTDAQKSSDIFFQSSSFNQHKGVVLGRIIDTITNLPVSYAEISCSDKTNFTKSNSYGEFEILAREIPM